MLPDPAAVKRVLTRLDGFARGLGLERAAVRQIVEGVVADLPDGTDDERLAEARKQMLKV